MEKFELVLSVFVIVGTILGTIVGSTVSETEMLKPKPQFTAEIDPTINNFTHGEKMIVSNIGNSQAKNSEIIIEAYEPLHITNHSCLEGNISENGDLVKITLEKFSTNISCIIEFNELPRNKIHTLVVTADDSDGYQHDFEKDDQKPSGFSPYLQFPIEFFIILISYAGAGFSFLYLIGKRIQQKKILEQYKQRERQLIQERELITQNLEFEKSKPVDSKKAINLLELEEKSIQNTNEISAAKIIQNYPRNVTVTNDFFEKWSELEKILLRLGSTMVSRIDKLKPMNVLWELKNKEIISQDLFSNLETLVNYRNSLVHGAIKLETTTLEDKIRLLNDSIKQLGKVKPSAVYTVSIPPGSSVPGCEETNECFIPYEIKMNEGQIVTWINDDTAAHTITSGSAADGLSGVFDSGLVMAGTTFSWKAKKKGTYPYHCMVHPWQEGIIIVE